jgi:hypothetical protein
MYYSEISMIRISKSRRMRWAGHVAGMGRRGISYIKDFGGKAGMKETTKKT